MEKAIADFNGIGGAGVVLDINTAEVLAMVSLPDYDASDPGGLQQRAEADSPIRLVAARAPSPAAAPRQDQDPHFNRATVGLYEPGSTFKLLTAAMALDYGTANIWSSFDASKPIRYGRFTISDYKGKHRALVLPEVLAYSSNLGAAHMAMGVGPTRHREFMARMGMLNRLGARGAGDGAAAGALGQCLARHQHHDRRLRPRHLGHAAACGECRLGHRQWRHPAGSRPSSPSRTAWRVRAPGCCRRRPPTPCAS